VNYKNVILLGGSGFVGRHLAVELAQRGFQVTIPCRRPQQLNALRVLSNITLRQANIMNPGELSSLCKGHDVVINLVGILNESKKTSFRKIHIDFIKTMVQACQNNGIKRLLHISALGANQASGSSQYLRSKGEGENLLHTYGQNKLEVTSFQPSVIFGPDDSFINRFAGVLRLCLGAFPQACPHSRFSPVYIQDVVSRIADSINNPDSLSRRYPLCGPETLTLLQIVEQIKQVLGYRCKIIGLSSGASQLQAMMLENLPGKLFALDNYRSLQTPSTCDSPHAPCPTSFSGYLKGLPGQYSRRPFYDSYRQHLNR